MSANWNTPALTDLYQDFLAFLKARDVDALTMLEGQTSTNLPVPAKRWNPTNKRFETWNGTAWLALVDKYAIDVDTVDGIHAGNAANQLLVLDGAALVPLPQIPGTLTGKNADMVDGYHAGNAAGQLLVLDGAALVPLAQIPGTLTGKIADDSNKLGGALPSVATAATTIAERDASGGLSAAQFVDTRAAASLFTRIGPSRQIRAVGGSSFNVVTTDGTVTITGLPAAAKFIKLHVRATLRSANSIAARYAIIRMYTTSSFLTIYYDNTLRAYEFNTLPANTLLSETNFEMWAPVVSGQAFMSVTTDAGGFSKVGWEIDEIID